ncbi:MAG: dihydrodipicolinate reductase [Chloroflexota bacterium]|nr:dihydrodipicolinate reductase [Chloroflexota bacterium]
MAHDIRAIQYGLGPIGSAIARQVVAREGIDMVGGVDVDPDKVGRDVGTVVGLGRPLGFPVMGHLSDALARADADVALHATSSTFDRFKPQLIEILEAGLDVVSTAEELSFPWLAHPDHAGEIDAVAKRVGRTVLGTGVNPGFLMDALPLNLTSICLQVDHISVTRVINASNRRGPFQAKIGSGLTVPDFQERMAAGRMGHVGLPESMGMIFDTLNRQVTRYQSDVEPLVAREPIDTGYVAVEPGQVRGLKQVARAYSEEGELVVLTFVAALEEEDEGDTIEIAGRPTLRVHLQGTNGDVATVAIVLNAVRRVREAGPGLVTMRDLPIVTCW